MEKLVRGLLPRPPPKALPKAEPKPPFVPVGLTLAKGEDAPPAPPKLRVGVGAGEAAAGLEGDGPPKGEVFDAEPPKTLPLATFPNEPNGDALEAASLAKPELAKAEVDAPFFSSLAESCDVADVPSFLTFSCVFLSTAAAGGA